MQMTLEAAAWTELAPRPREFVRGSKVWWALAILVNFAGPLAYFRWGRRTWQPLSLAFSNRDLMPAAKETWGGGGPPRRGARRTQRNSPCGMRSSP